MAHWLEPLQLNDGTRSDRVFFLCDGDETPLQSFQRSCRNKAAVAKMAASISYVHTAGIGVSRKAKRIKCLNSGNGGDLYEITTGNCTARAYSYLVNGEEVLVVAFIEEVTHSGTGMKDTRRAIEKLEQRRPYLEEALQKGFHHGTQL